MKQYVITLAIVVNFFHAHSQPAIDFSKFPTGQNNTTLLTKDLLDTIGWQAIKANCKRENGHYADENTDSLLSYFRYVKQGGEPSFEIVSYDGMVMKSYTNAGRTKKQNVNFYLDKNVWLKYVSRVLPLLPKNLKLTKEESDTSLLAYYALLGVGTPDEYGFICEYSTIGMPPKRRRAVIELIKQHRIDLIKKLSGYSNLQTKLYAIDALVYIDYIAKSKIQILEKDVTKDQKELYHFQKNNDQPNIEKLTKKIKLASDSITYFTTDLLTPDEWKMIYELRDSNQIVKTCGNSGSYKTYKTPVSELLSDKAIANIPKWYEALKPLGYFR